MRPTDLGARIHRHLLVLLRGPAGNSVGPHHFVALEDWRTSAARGNASVGHGGQAHQQLRIAFLEPLLDDKPVEKPWAHRTECGDCEGLRDCSFGRDEASVIHALHCNDMTLWP